MLQVGSQDLRTLRRALNCWSDQLARDVSRSPDEQRYRDESNRVIALLAKIDELENRASRFAWGPGDIEFLPREDET